MRTVKYLKTALCVIVLCLMTSGCANHHQRAAVEPDYDQIAQTLNETLSALDTGVNNVVVVNPILSERLVKNTVDSGIDFVTTISIISIVTPFVFIIALIWLILYYKRRSQKERLQVLELAIKHGYPLPQTFYDRNNSPRQQLKSGLSFIAWGLGIMIFFFAVGTSGTAMIFLVIVLIGLAKIGMYLYDSKHTNCVTMPRNTDEPTNHESIEEVDTNDSEY